MAEYTQSHIQQQSVSVSWALVLGSAVSASWVLSRPQTQIIARNPELHLITGEVREDNA